MSVVTRFAPSPTGFLHIGGLRTALYAYLFAKKHQGKLILRIEDTDQTRFVEGATENLISSLTWGKIKFDEGPHLGGENGPYMQSERTETYRKYCQELIESGHAYRCFCTKERLDEMRSQQQAKKVAPMYDRKCLYLSQEEIEEKIKAGEEYVVRLKIPHDEKIAYHDMIRGDMEFLGHTIDDQVLLKSDNFPTYHLANVVDDHLMRVTHVIRGEEWLPSTPKHIFLYRAFGWKEPEFAHIPLLLNEDRTKLSKRQGHVAVEEYIKDGYLPDAIINYIALLGWNPGTTQEIFSLSELIQSFELGRVQKAGAVFSMERLNWFNKKYMKEMSIEELTEKTLPFLRAANLQIPEDHKFLQNCIKLSFERWNCFKEAPENLKHLLEGTDTYNLDLFKNEKMGVDKLSSLKAVTLTLESNLVNLEEFDDEEKIKEELLKIVSDHNLKNGQLLWPLRVALTNAPFSPGVFELMHLLGKERSIKRLLSAKSYLESN